MENMYGTFEERLSTMTLEELEELDAEERRKRTEACYRWREQNRDFYNAYQRTYKRRRKERLAAALQKARAAQQEGGEQK